jgi:hypothetical protein
MRCTYRLRQNLLGRVHEDLNRQHPFAAERVGFLFGRAARIGNDGLIILATEYEPIADDDYVDDPSVGAMMDATAIRKALERALNGGAGDLSVFHVHRHEHDGAPWFSSIDLCESAKFAPSFFHVAPKIPHGVIVLSHDQAAGPLVDKRRRRSSTHRSYRECRRTAALLGRKQMNPQLVSQRFLGPDSEVVLAGLTALLAVAAAARMLFNSLRMSALAALCP